MRIFNFLKLPSINVFTFWGVFDAFYMLSYLTYNLSAGQFPYTYELKTARMLLPNPMWLIWAPSLIFGGLFYMAFLLNISVIASCLMFLMGRRSVRHLLNFQAFMLGVFTLAFGTFAYTSLITSVKIGSAVLAVISLVLLIARAFAARRIGLIPKIE